MATVDPSELLSDPDLIDTFIVTRKQQTLDEHGRTWTSGGVSKRIFGVVVPASGRTLNIMPDLTSVQGVIEVWTKFRLEVASDTTQPDMITWQGRDYIVNVVQPYTNFGTGFVHAVATQQQLLAHSPTKKVTMEDTA